jgi:hypothetical protein
MPWAETQLPWNRSVILSEVPAEAGVYAIWRDTTCLYVGASYDLERRLLEHFNGSNACIIRAQPTTFGFELAVGLRRVERQCTLVRELNPLCNPDGRAGSGAGGLVFARQE